MLRKERDRDKEKTGEKGCVSEKGDNILQRKINSTFLVDPEYSPHWIIDKLP